MNTSRITKQFPNNPEITPYEDQTGKRSIDDETVNVIRAHLKSGSEPNIPQMSRQEAITQARAALKAAEQKRLLD